MNRDARSNCCQAPVTVSGYYGTKIYVCNKCQNPCDLYHQTPDKLNEEIREILREYGGDWYYDGQVFDPTDDIEHCLQLITTAYAEAMNEVIGEDVKPDFDDDDWFCQRCSFSPTDGSKDCICKYNNRLKRRQRQRLKGLLPNGKDE